MSPRQKPPIKDSPRYLTENFTRKKSALTNVTLTGVHIVKEDPRK